MFVWMKEIVAATCPSNKELWARGIEADDHPVTTADPPPMCVALATDSQGL